MTAWRVVGSTRDSRPDSSVGTPVTPAIKTGDLMGLPAETWSAPRTVVLVLSSTCPACIENLPFYRELAAQATSQLPVVVVSNQPQDEIAGWLARNQVEVKSIHTVTSLPAHGLTLTPMVLIVNAEGVVTDLMIRRLDEAKQAQVLGRLRNPNATALDNSQQIREISVDDWQRMTSGRRVQILDVRSRERFRSGHRADARNIPSRELDARAQIELDLRLPVIVDCLQPEANACRNAAWTLIDGGFDDVSLLIR